MTEPLANMGKPRLPVEHAALVRIDGSAYKSVCPACQIGLLVMRRNAQFQLEPTDRCTHCGQPVYYLDIGRLRTEEAARRRMPSYG